MYEVIVTIIPTTFILSENLFQSKQFRSEFSLCDLIPNHPPTFSPRTSQGQLGVAALFLSSNKRRVQTDKNPPATLSAMIARPVRSD